MPPPRSTRKKFFPKRQMKKGLRQEIQKLKYIQRQILKSQEDKIFDIKILDSEIANTGILFVINNPGQGDTDITRDGDKLMAKRIEVRGYLLVNNTSVDQTNKIRILLLWDKQVTIATIADVFESVNNANSPNAMWNHDLRKRFLILYDKSFVVNLNSNGMVQFHINKKLNKIVTFEAGTTTINTGCLSLVVVSNEAAGGDKPTITFTSRLSFIDS